MEFLKSLNRGTMAFLAIGAFIFFMLVFNPPKSLCEVQLDGFKKSQVGFLSPDPKKKAKQKISDFKKFSKYCKDGYFKQGACFEFFSGLRKMVAQTKAISLDCYKDLAGLSSFKKALWGSLEMFGRFAWGDKPPESRHLRFGWLDASSIGLYCQLKGLANEMHGTGYWGKWIRQTAKTFPGAERLTFEDIWTLSLYSVNCNNYR